MHDMTIWTIPNGITEITKEYRQANMPSGTTRVIIPEGVTSIGESAFEDCSSITQINLPEGVTSIGESAFEDCSSITQINLPEGVTSIGKCAFKDCTSVTEINLPEGVTSIGNHAFHGCSSITQINLPEGVTSIGRSAFSRCTSVTEINIPEGVASIGDYAFCGCSSLTKIEIPSGVTSIGEDAFRDCKSLTQINIPEGVTSIWDWAFYGCRRLTQIILPDDFCTDAEEGRLGITGVVRCIGYGEMKSLLNDTLKIEGVYTTEEQALLYRLSSNSRFNPNELEKLKDCAFEDIMKAIKHRRQQVERGTDGDIRVLMNGMFGESIIDQTVAVDEILKLDYSQIVKIGTQNQSKTLLSYLTVKELMRCHRCRRDKTGLLKQSMFHSQGIDGERRESASKKSMLKW